jgi:sporulation protein YlmC with PRC-barrel domain
MEREHMDVGFHLLDRQILDRYGQEVGKVDDVEFTVPEHGPPYLSGLLVGPQAIGPRIGGWLGRAVAGAARRLRGAPGGPLRIPFDVVGNVGIAITLTISRDLLVEPELEHWLRNHVIARIPGSGDAE